MNAITLKDSDKQYDSVIFDRPLKHYTYEEIVKMFPNKFVLIVNPDSLGAPISGYVLAAVDPRDVDMRLKARESCEPGEVSLEISTTVFGWRAFV